MYPMAIHQGDNAKIHLAQNVKELFREHDMLHKAVQTMLQLMHSAINDKGSPTNISVHLFGQAVYISNSLCLYVNIKIYCCKAVVAEITPVLAKQLKVSMSYQYFSSVGAVEGYRVDQYFQSFGWDGAGVWYLLVMDIAHIALHCCHSVGGQCASLV